jgi:hypothetical protein
LAVAAARGLVFTAEVVVVVQVLKVWTHPRTTILVVEVATVLLLLFLERLLFTLVVAEAVHKVQVTPALLAWVAAVLEVGVLMEHLE